MHDEPEFFRSGGVVLGLAFCWQGRFGKDAMMDSTAEHDTAGYLEVAGRLAHADLLKTMPEKVSPRHCALLVIDMQNYVVLPRDAAGAYSTIDHEQTLANIDRFFGELSSIDELCTIWQRSNCGHASVNS
jgi:hypothetical protein